MVVLFTIKERKYMPKRESIHANVQSCPSNEKRELFLPVTKMVL